MNGLLFFFLESCNVVVRVVPWDRSTHPVSGKDSILEGTAQGIARGGD
jgi:hypothetical protein